MPELTQRARVGRKKKPDPKNMNQVEAIIAIKIAIKASAPSQGRSLPSVLRAR
jgi:hypothetical protein